MRLSRKIDKALVLIGMASLLIILAVFLGSSSRNTFADSDNFSLVAADSESSKFVTFYDDGEKLTIKTEAATVREAIERVGLVINDGDKIEPGLDTEINSDNYNINIHRARPVVIKDGDVEKYIMTASYDTISIAKEAGLTIYDGDEIEMIPNQNFLEAGIANSYKVVRNGGRTITVEEEIMFGEETIKDPSMESGKSEVRQLGEVGLKKINYTVYYIDNKEVSREMVSEEIVREPVSRIVAVGAKRSLPPASGTCADWARQAGVSEADLPAALDLIYHESGCRFDAANPSGAYGIPQALPGSKMASAGADWETNPVTQIRWMIGYVNGRYGGWNQAIDYWYQHGWY